MFNNQAPNYKQLISHLVCEGTDSYVVEQLIAMFPTPKDLLEANENELTQLKGVGKVRARQIVAALQISRTISLTTEPITIIKSPSDIKQLMTPILADLSKEHFISVFLNTKNKVIGWETISIGTLNGTLVHPREVFRPAIILVEIQILAQRILQSQNDLLRLAIQLE